MFQEMQGLTGSYTTSATLNGLAMRVLTNILPDFQTCTKKLCRVYSGQMDRWVNVHLDG